MLLWINFEKMMSKTISIARVLFASERIIETRKLLSGMANLKIIMSARMDKASLK